MSQETTAFILTVTGGCLMLLVGIVGYFLKSIITQQRKNTENIGRQIGKLNVIESINETKLENVSANINSLTDSLREHTRAIDERMTQKDGTNEMLIGLIKNMTAALNKN